MALVQLDDDLHRNAKLIVSRKPIDYPNLKNFVNKAVRKLVEEQQENVITSTPKRDKRKHD